MTTLILELISNGIIQSLIASSIIYIIGFLIFNNYVKKLKSEPLLQTFIYTNPNYILCNKSEYKINEIPEVLAKYRKKLYNTYNRKEELYFWKTRISTYLIFTDGKRLLLLDRSKHSNNQIINNQKLDCYGAVKFHNISLKYKLPKIFMESEIIKIEAIPGISLEYNIKKYLFGYIKSKQEIAVMLGFIAYLSPENLDLGLDNVGYDKNYKNDNIIIDLSCLSIEDENLTAKVKLGIRHLKKIANKAEEGIN